MSKSKATPKTSKAATKTAIEAIAVKAANEAVAKIKPVKANPAAKKAASKTTPVVKKAHVNDEGSLVLPNQMPSKPKKSLKDKMSAAEKKKHKAAAAALAKEKAESIEKISKAPKAKLQEPFKRQVPTPATPMASKFTAEIAPATVAQSVPQETVKRPATVAARFGGASSSIPSIEVARSNWLGSKR